MRKSLIGRKVLAGVVAAGLAVSLAACGSDSDSGGSDTIVLGTKDFTEQFVLGELYAQALRAAGFKVELKKNIGSSELIDKTLTSKQIDMYPEYTGVIYSNKDLANLGDHPQSAQITYDGAKKWEAGRGYTMLNRTPFENADGFAVTKAYAAQHKLKTIDDMKTVGEFTYAGPPENKTRYQGVVGLKQAYGLNKIDFKPLATGKQYDALDGGDVDSIAIFTTDGQLASGKYAILSDTKKIFGFQNVAPVIRDDIVKKYGSKFVNTLNKLTALLTPKAIIGMNSAAQLQKVDPAKVATTFLKANGIVK